MTKICVALTPSTTAQALEQMARQSAEADLFELRVDAMSECDLARILGARSRPLIVTNRAADEGGRKDQDEGERLKVLAEAVRLGADYVDVELASLGRLEKLLAGLDRGATKLIVSYHDPEGMPQDLVKIARKIESTQADVVKVVATARRPEDNLPCFEVLRSAGKPTIALAMGEAGQMSRILAGKFGALLTFAAADTEGGSAPGQISARQMRDLYRAQAIGPATKVYAVLGNPVEHSLSPAIHNAAFQAEGIDAVYLRLKVEG
ncbi:MAG: type I 3-dehydroquinate dehydratase, partial [Anaerolineaceae bacterium]|nr:type I 3-dehydroquinate dehydratase [Anaerolineaceae bacterium]